MNVNEIVIKPIFRVNTWLNKKLSFPGADQHLIQQKKVFIAGYFIASIGVMLMSLMAWQLQIFYLLRFGWLLIGFYLIIIPLLFLIKKGIEWLCFIGTVWLILVTFLYNLWLGGLLNSHGIIFTSLATVIFIVMLKSRIMIAVACILYFATILLSGILQPYLVVPKDFSPFYNVIFFTINTIWVSGFMIIFIYIFISQRSKAEKEEAKKLKLLDEAKTRLFINITHEFRTPLTVILGLTERLKVHPDKNPEDGLQRIEQNSRRLLYLVNQMLDFSRLEAGAMPIHFIHGDIIRYLRYLLELYQPLAFNKQISLRFESDLKDLEIDYEPEKLLHIVSNLLSNSIKFTPKGGEIKLSTGLEYGKKTAFLIQISDTGIGIPAQKLKSIFDRFYQIEDKTLHHTTGSGLGLALTKEFVKLMGGEITVNSTEGKGTVFSIVLPVTHFAPERDEIIDEDLENWVSSMDLPMEEADNILTSPENNKELPVLLIVEDNADVIYYLRSLLEAQYNIEISKNGEEGLKKALDLTPDIIISDIMMPVMDGFEMLDRLKNDIRTSHIPIILLTAKADINSRIEGLERGADAFLAKPFNENELMVSLKTLIDLRIKLRQRYASIRLPEPSQDKSFQWEDSFMQQVHKILDQNYKNEDLNIIRFCKDMGMSRTQLYRKFKALSDKTLNEYIRSFRLDKARELLATTSLNVSQVAFEVGFKNLSHFSHIFYKEFGLNPREIRS